MSPAGHWPQLNAAIEAGADAVYFGLHHFTARAKTGFELSELGDAMRTLHRRGVRGYVTFNALAFEHELAEAARALGKIAEAGADAVIVQDLGLVKLAREVVPSLEIHGSTQMSITSAEGVNLAQSLGVTRVVLARELSLSEIRSIRNATTCELEVFVHGALCVSYSGQCFSSEAWGGRSANRGQCAQACRLPYELVVDGHVAPLGDARYLLSPGDLYALRQIPDLIDIGVHALKIEGRYKDAGYVALITQAYRKAVDEAWEHHRVSVSKADELRIEQVYSRGLGPFFLAGTNHQAVVRGRAPRHRGVEMGRVAEVRQDSVVVAPNEAHRISPLKAGDGVVFDSAEWRSPQEPEEGGRLFSVAQAKGKRLELTFANSAVDFTRIRPGDILWRSHDPSIDKAVRPFLDAAHPVAKQPLKLEVEAIEGRPLELRWTLMTRPEVEFTQTSDEPLGQAQKRALTPETLRDQLGRLGNTPYRLVDLHAVVQGQPFAPVSILNHLRRQAVEALERLQTALPPIEARPYKAPPPSKCFPTDGQPELHLLVRAPGQLEAAIVARPASITLDYLDFYGLQPSKERIQSAGLLARVASPRILKPDDQRIIHFLRKLDIPVVVRSTGLLWAFTGSPRPDLIGDFSLNAANPISAELLLELGLTRVTPTHDLNADQITRLARQVGGGRIEVVAYQHLPVFHTEHCVFCRFLSTGTSYLDCGRPCEKHLVSLKDDKGRVHPVLADVGCRNTVFGAEAQEASAHLAHWLRAGIRHFRLEFTHETPGQVSAVTEAFNQALQGEITSQTLAQKIRSASPEGTTEGSLFVPPGYLALPVLQ